MNLSAYVQRYENELIDNVIPFWETHCVDQEYGGYFTSLDRDGSVYDTEKYMWMQWRIVYMFATFYMSPYRQERWLEIARQGFDFLTKHGKSGDGTYYFALNRQYGMNQYLVPYLMSSHPGSTLKEAAELADLLRNGQ